MLRRTRFPWVLGVVGLFCWSPSPTHAQLNAAYSNGYKPATELNDKLKDLIGSADKREDYSGVKDLGDKYSEKLYRAQKALETAGDWIPDDTVKGSVHTFCANAQKSAERAKERADKLKEKGDAKQNCLAEALSLQKAMEEFSKDMEKCWKEHQDYDSLLLDRFLSAESKWEDAAKDVSKEVEDLGKRAGDAREKAKELRGRANEVARIASEARQQVDKLRSELFSKDAKLSPEEVESKFETYKKADDLMIRAFSAQTEAEKAAAEADKQYSDAQASFQKAVDDFTKKEAEENDIFRAVLLHRKRLALFRKEYTAFSW